MQTGSTSQNVRGSAAARNGIRSLLVLLACFAITAAVQALDVPSPSSTFVFILAYLAAFLLIIAPAIIFCVARRLGPRDVGIVGPRTLVSNAVGVVAFAGVLVAGPLLLDIFFWGEHAVASVAAARTLAVFAMAAIAEEYLFRGFLQPRLVMWLGSFRGIVVAAVCFSLFHLPKLVFAGLAAPSLAVMCALLATAGVIFGVAAHLFKDIYASIWLHLAANILVGLL